MSWDPFADLPVVSDLESLVGTSSHSGRRRPVDPSIYAVNSLDVPRKRRKSERLNSRFDRMEETVHALNRQHSPPRRRRASSISGSSSTASYDIPRTPIDAYSGLDGGRLGSDFSTIRNNSLSYSAGRHNSDIDAVFGSPLSTENPQRVAPSWLQNTVASLKKNHPLRSFISVIQPISSLSSRTQPMRNEEDIFAFHPPTSIAVDRLSSSVDPGAALQPALNLIPTEALPKAPASGLPLDSLGLSPHELPYSNFTALGLGYAQNDILIKNSLNNASVAALNQAAPDVYGDGSSPLSFGHDTPLPLPLITEEENPSLDAPSDFVLSSSPELALPDLRESSFSPVRSLSPRSSDSASSPMPYTTPGPMTVISSSAVAVPRKAPAFHVYFESPAEDPISSDPLERPDYELDLDYEDFDFKWEKFDRSGLDLRGSSSSLPDLIAPAQDRELVDVTEGSVDNQQLVLNQPALEDMYPAQGDQYLPNASQKTHGSFDDLQVQTADRAENEHPLDEPLSHCASPQSFAPAPGIYISPLRGSQCGDGESGIPAASGIQQQKEVPNDEAELTSDMPSVKDQPDDDTSKDTAGVFGFPLARVTSFKTPSPQPHARDRENQITQSGQVGSSQESRDSIESWTNA